MVVVTVFVVLVVVAVVCMYVLSFDTDCYIPRWCSDMEDNDEEGEDDLEDALSEFEAADKVRTVYYSVVDCVTKCGVGYESFFLFDVYMPPQLYSY